MQFCAQDVLTSDVAVTVSPSNREAELSALAAECLHNSGRLRLRVRGESMLPTLWPGDVVEIARCSLNDAQPGEIVLARRDGRFFLHRLFARSEPSGFLLRGDSMPRPDPQFSDAAFLGRLAACAEQPQSKFPLRAWSRVIGFLLCHCGPARRLALLWAVRRRPNSAATLAPEARQA